MKRMHAKYMVLVGRVYHSDTLVEADTNNLECVNLLSK